MQIRKMSAITLVLSFSIFSMEGMARPKRLAQLVETGGWSIERELRPAATREEARAVCKKARRVLVPLRLLVKASLEGLFESEPTHEWSEDGESYQDARFKKQRRTVLRDTSAQNGYRRPYRCGTEVSLSM